MTQKPNVPIAGPYAPLTVDAFPATMPPTYPAHHAVSSSQARQLLVDAEVKFGIPPMVLHDHAGRGLAAIAASLGTMDACTIVLCGPGSVQQAVYSAARFLLTWGRKAIVLKITDDATPVPAVGTECWLPDGLVRQVTPSEAPTVWREATRGVRTVIIDGLYGMEDHLELAPAWIELVNEINADEATRVSADVPSGMHPDTGVGRPVTVRADATGTFGMPKLGLLQNKADTGVLIELGIGLPWELHGEHLANAHM